MKDLIAAIDFHQISVWSRWIADQPLLVAAVFVAVLAPLIAVQKWREARRRSGAKPEPWRWQSKRDIRRARLFK